MPPLMLTSATGAWHGAISAYRACLRIVADVHDGNMRGTHSDVVANKATRGVMHLLLGIIPANPDILPKDGDRSR